MKLFYTVDFVESTINWHIIFIIKNKFEKTSMWAFVLGSVTQCFIKKCKGLD